MHARLSLLVVVACLLGVPNAKTALDMGPLTPPLGATRSVTRGTLGNTLQTKVGERTTTVTPDGHGRSLAVATPGGHSIQNQYSPLGLKTTTDRSGLPHTLGRTPAGFLDKLTKAGTIETDLTQDANFRIAHTQLDDANTGLSRQRTQTFNGLGIPGQTAAGCGAQVTNTYDGRGLLRRQVSPYAGTNTYDYDAGDLLVSVNENGRITRFERDANGNITNTILPGPRVIAQTFDPLDRLETRRTPLDGSTVRLETFQRDAEGNITNHIISLGETAHTTALVFDEAHRLVGLGNGEFSRGFTYTDDDRVEYASFGGQTVGYGYTPDGWLNVLAREDNVLFEFARDPEGRLEKVTRDGSTIYHYDRDSAKRLTAITDSADPLGGPKTITLTPDVAGYGWTRTLPEGLTLVQAINDVDSLTTSTLDGNPVAFTLAEHVRPAAADRPGPVPDLAWSYNQHKEITAVGNADGSAGVTLTRDEATGQITSRTLPHLGVTDTFTYNAEGWLTSETRDGYTVNYTYRPDGVRLARTADDDVTTAEVPPAGQILSTTRTWLAPTPSADLAGDIYRVGQGAYATIEEAAAAVYAARGNEPFAVPAVIVVALPDYTSAVVLNTNLADLHPTPEFPLIIRSATGMVARLTGGLSLSGLSNIWVQGLWLSGTNAASEPNTLAFSNAVDVVLASCVIQAETEFFECSGARIVGNTFGYPSGAMLTVTNSSAVLMRNNLYLGNSTNVYVSFDPAEADSDFNCYWPTNAVQATEPNSVYADPRLSPHYRIVSFLSPALNAGEAQTDMNVDALGNLRSESAPCIGAFEYCVRTNVTTMTVANGCITERVVNDQTCGYQYDGQGRLSAFTDDENPANNAAYSYDPFGRRYRVTVGDSVTRMIYQGHDVVAEYTDQDGNGTVDKTRLYWLMPEIDQRIGFVDIEGENKTFYYYVCDQVGSVLQVIRQDGVVVNQYDYDAWGNRREENTFENVENRYQFQGREWDSRAGHYFFRNRIYFPDWGQFATPDMNLALGPAGEPMGMGSHGAFDNAPLQHRDEFGLAPTMPEQITLDPASGGMTIGFEGEIDARYKDYNVPWQYTDPLGRLIAQSQVQETVAPPLACLPYGFAPYYVGTDGISEFGASFLNWYALFKNAGLGSLYTLSSGSQKLDEYAKRYVKMSLDELAANAQATPFPVDDLALYAPLMLLRLEVRAQALCSRTAQHIITDPARLLPSAVETKLLTQGTRVKAANRLLSADMGVKRYVTVLGSGRDVSPFKGVPGYNVLEMDYTLPLEMRKAINTQWLNAAVDRGDTILLRTQPFRWEAFMREIGKESFYNDLELPLLLRRGVLDDAIPAW